MNLLGRVEETEAFVPPGKNNNTTHPNHVALPDMNKEIQNHLEGIN